MGRQIRWIGGAAALLLLGPAATPAPAAPAAAASATPTLRAVELATRGDGGAVSGVNPRGQVIGVVGDGQGNSDPVIWTRYDTATPIGVPRTDAKAINDRGDVLGEDCLWVDGDITVLQHPDGKPWTSGLNNRRQVIGVMEPFQANPLRASRWQDGAYTYIPAPAGMVVQPTAINERGDVSGRVHNDGGTVQHGFFWRDGVMTVFRAPVGDGYVEPEAMNDRGEVIGSYTAAGSTVPRPFRWHAGRMTDLLAGRPGGGHAYAINNAGVVVGDAGGRPALWRAGRTIDLGTPGRTGTALEINERGDVAGTSTSTADARAFRWRAGRVAFSQPYGIGTQVEVDGLDARGRVVGTVVEPDFTGHHPTVWF